MKNYFSKISARRVWMMLLGNVLAGLGISIFRLSGLGNDPFTGMNLALSAIVGLPYAHFQVFFNLGLFVIQLLFGRELIGMGTVINAFFLGYIVSFFYPILTAIAQPETLIQRVITVAIGVVICGLGLSLYQTSNLGVAPYDGLSLITKKYLPKITYFWHRIAFDGAAALICFLAGGIIGLGTLATAFGFGPVIHFFNEHLSNKLLEGDPKKVA